MRRALALFLCAPILAVALPGCGAAPTLDARQPGMPEDGAFKNTARCAVSGAARPLVVEWPSSDRAELEARAQKGVVPVKWVGCEMVVLSRCTAPGRYAYTGITKKTDHIVMQNADEVYANIPVYAAKFEGKLKKSGALDVAMTIVGRYESDRATVRTDELSGDCAEATHVVMGVTVGAFEFSAGASADAGASAQMMNASAGGATSTHKETLNRDGDEASCAKAGGGDKAPPFGCGAVLRLEVVPLGAGKQTEPVCPPGTKWADNQCVAVVNTSCPGGTRFEAGKGCVPGVAARPAFAPAPRASCGDVDACVAACDKGGDEGARSCTAAGGMLRDGKGAAKDATRAAGLFKKACDAGDVRACAFYGEAMYLGVGATRDPAGATPFFRKACGAGDQHGCVDLGRALEDGVAEKADPRAAAVLYERACDAGEPNGCIGLGMLLKNGKGVAKDATRSGAALKKGCDAGSPMACKLASAP